MRNPPHYRGQHFNGYSVKTATDDDYRAKLKARCTVTESGCWEIGGFRNKMWGDPKQGYGYMCYRGKNWIASRLAFFLHKGAIPKGLDVRHTCDNPPCCNPDHLELGTRQQNIRDCVGRGRQFSRMKTHCPRGHAYAEHGREYFSDKCIQQATPWRACKACQRIGLRRKAGWPEHLWEIPPMPKGQRPHLPHPKKMTSSAKA